MTMQRGFGASPDVAPAPNTGDPLLGSGIFHISSDEGKNRRTTILLDDEPVWGYRHKIKRPYVPGKKDGDWKERDIRLTCAIAHDKHDHPRECLACEAAIRHGDIIKRHFTANLTCIDVGEHRTKKNTVYHDLKKLLELDWAAYETFREQKKALGSLVGMAFSVMRPTGDPKQSKTYGIWTPLQRVNVLQHFYSSPAVKAIMDHAHKRGERISQQEAAQRLVTPIDYSKELNNYSPQLAERFVMRAVSRAGSTASEEGFQSAPNGFQSGFQGGPQFQGQGQFQQPGFQGAPTMQPSAAPDYSVAPQHQQMQPQGQGQFQQPMQPQMQPQGAPPGFQQQPFQGAPMGFGNGGGSVPPPPQGGPQGYQPQNFSPTPAPTNFAPQPQQGQTMMMQPQGPPQVGNPMGSTMPPGMNMSQQPQGQPSLAPWAGQPPLPGQPQMPQGQPQPQMQPQQPQGGGYGFDQQPGWSSQFPGQPAQPQMQMQQPQQGYQQQMQPAPMMQPQAAPPGFQQQPGMNVPPPPGKLPF